MKDRHLLSNLQPALLTLTSALLLPLSLPSPLFAFGNPLLGVIALIPLYIMLRSCGRYRSAARHGFLFGAVSTAVGSFWLAFFQDFSVWTLGGAVLGYAIYNMLLFVFLRRSLLARLPMRPLWFAAIWTAYELLKSIGFLGYPWGLLAYSWNEVLPIIQTADLFGVYGLTFLLVLANAVIAEWIGAEWKNTGRSRELLRATALLAVLFAASWVYGLVQLQQQPKNTTPIDIILVQNDGDSWEAGRFWSMLESTQQLTEEALALSDTPPDLVVWSETILRYPIREFRSYYQQNPRPRPFTEFLADLPSELLSGGPFMIDGRSNTLINAALLLNAEAEILQVYGKRQLVPFAEAIPFYGLAPVRAFFQNVVGLPSTWLNGQEYRMFPLISGEGSELSYGTPICFEDAFGHITRDMANEGADFFVNLTNNSWSRTNSAQTQHFAAARFRSVETRRPLLRATNSGYTATIDRHGRVTASLPMFTPAALRTTVEIPTDHSTTVYMLAGDLLPLLLLLATFGALLYRHLQDRLPGKKNPYPQLHG